MSVVKGTRAAAAEPTGLTREVAFEVLSSQRRRYVLHHLLGDEDGTSELRELTTQIAAWENDTDPESVTSKQRMRVYTALRQSHLPKMDREGVVSFDPVSGEVELTDEAKELEVYLDVVPHDEIPWSDYYLGLGALGLVAIAFVAVGVPPFDLLPALGWAAVIGVAVTASGVAHKLHNNRMRLGSDGEPPA